MLNTSCCWYAHDDASFMSDSVFCRTHSRSAQIMNGTCSRLLQLPNSTICRPRSVVKWHSHSSYHHLTTVFDVDLYFAREVKWNGGTCKQKNHFSISFYSFLNIIFLLAFINLSILINIYQFFLLYLSIYGIRSQKYFFFFFPVICDLTRRNRFFIHAKCLILSLHKSCRYSRLRYIRFMIKIQILNVNYQLQYE